MLSLDVFRTPTSSVSLLYHDVVPDHKANTSGVTNKGSWRYKLPPERFANHLEIIKESAFTPRLVTQGDANRSVYLTFDDGGRSAITAARMLEEYGYKGHFFVITDRVGDENYLKWSDIDQLVDAGHLIGSHTCTHVNLVAAGEKKRKEELIESKEELEDRYGSCCSISIPKGMYNQAVSDAIREAGYKYTFTSEPERISSLQGKRRIGRWNIWNHTDSTDLDAILDLDPTLYLTAVGRWKTLKYVKKAIGKDRFVRLRNTVLR